MDRKLARWLNMKAEKDAIYATVGTDPYVDMSTDIFDEYRDEDDGDMDDYFESIRESGIDTG